MFSAFMVAQIPDGRGRREENSLRGDCSSSNWKLQLAIPPLPLLCIDIDTPQHTPLGGLGYRCKMVFSPGIYFCLLLLGMRRCSGLSPFRPFSLFIPDSGFHFSSPSPTTQFLAASPSLLPSLPISSPSSPPTPLRSAAQVKRCIRGNLRGSKRMRI